MLCLSQRYSPLYAISATRCSFGRLHSSVNRYCQSSPQSLALNRAVTSASPVPVSSNGRHRGKQFHSSASLSLFSLHEISEALSHHPAIVAVTGAGGGVGVIAGLYRTAALWKLVASASMDRSILLLPQKPSHIVQQRAEDVRKIRGIMKSLRKQNGRNVAVTVYVTGPPGYGKSQLAREFGQEFYRKNRGFVFRKLFVGTLNASSRSSFLQSYITLALELGCANEVKTLETLSGKKGELQSLELLSATVRKELKKRPGWLLIVDNLSPDVKPMDGAGPPGIVDYLPAIATSTVPDASGISTLHHERSSNVGVAAAYGIAILKAAWRSFWPQAGDESWGQGYVLVTTNDRRLVERSSPFASEIHLHDGMAEDNAVSLLKKVSGCSGEGAKDVVNSLDRVPLSVASAGFYIAAERQRNPSYSFRDYLSGLEKGIQDESEAMLISQNLSYPVTMTMAITLTLQGLLEDPNLNKVFLLLAICSQSPVPMRLISRVLKVRPDINSAALESVRNCSLLAIPSMHSPCASEGESAAVLPIRIEAVSLYRGTHKVLQELLLGQSAAKQHGDLSWFVDCLFAEYETAHFSDSVSSYRMRHLLLPHMEAHLKAMDTVPDLHLDVDQEIKLCHALGSGYLLVGQPHKAKTVLERALQSSEEHGRLGTLEVAGIASTLGTTYRHLALQSESELVLKEALSIYERECGEDSIQVARALSNLSATYKHKGLYHDSRRCLEKALMIYEKDARLNRQSVASVLTNLGTVWRNLGDSHRSKELFERALVIQDQLYEPQHPAIALTLGSLSVSYSDIGQPRKSIELLKRALEINQSVHGPDHISVAITLSNLSIAYRHMGDVKKSRELAEEALQKTEAIHGPGHPGVAVGLGILGSTYCDLGELAKAKGLLEKSVRINQTTSGEHHVGTAIAQTQLGRVVRLNGELLEAKKILEVALETKQMALGRGHPGESVTLKSLGKVYHELGHFTQSLQALEQVQAIGQKLFHLNPSHPQIAFTEADVARVIRDCGDPERACVMMQQAIERYTSMTDDASNLGYTKSHPKFTSMLAILGLIQRDLDRLQEARRSLETALRMQQEILSEQSLMKAETMCNLGTVMHRMGNRRGALEYMDSALTLMKSVKHEHPITATISAAVAQLLLDMGNVHSARLSLEDALEIRSKCCTELHPSNALYHKLLAGLADQDEHGADKAGLMAEKHLIAARAIYGNLFQREQALSEKAGLRSQIPVIGVWEREAQLIEEQLKSL